MTLLNINLTDVLSETDPDDRVLVWAPTFREGSAGGLVGPRQKAIPLVDGVGADEVVPGPLMVQVRCKAISDTHPRKVVVPEEGPVTLTELLDSAGAFTYSPAVVDRVALDAQRAEDAAVRAEGVADSTHWQDDRLSVMGQLGPSLTGPVGPKGEIGPRGEVGPRGEKGDAGEDGRSITIIGAVATVADLPLEGSLGDGYITDTDGHLHVWSAEGWTDVGEIRGPQGVQGPQGNPGERGPKGDKGDPGIQGVQGPEGSEGPEGPMGPEGPQGPPGDGGTGGSWVLAATLPTSPDPDTLYLIPED